MRRYPRWLSVEGITGRARTHSPLFKVSRGRLIADQMGRRADVHRRGLAQLPSDALSLPLSLSPALTLVLTSVHSSVGAKKPCCNCPLPPGLPFNAAVAGAGFSLPAHPNPTRQAFVGPLRCTVQTRDERFLAGPWPRGSRWHFLRAMAQGTPSRAARAALRLARLELEPRCVFMGTFEANSPHSAFSVCSS